MVLTHLGLLVPLTFAKYEFGETGKLGATGLSQHFPLSLIEGSFKIT